MSAASPGTIRAPGVAIAPAPPCDPREWTHAGLDSVRKVSCPSRHLGSAQPTGKPSLRRSRCGPRAAGTQVSAPADAALRVPEEAPTTPRCAWFRGSFRSRPEPLPAVPYVLRAVRPPMKRRAGSRRSTGQKRRKGRSGGVAAAAACPRMPGDDAFWTNDLKALVRGWDSRRGAARGETSSPSRFSLAQLLPARRLAGARATGACPQG